MAISKDQLTVEVVLDSSGAIKGIKDLQGQFVALDKIVSQSTKTTDKANQSTGKVGEAFAGLSSTLSKAALPLLAVQTAVTAVTQVFGVLSSALGSFVDDYAAAEKAQTLLTQAIENSNGRIQNSADAWGAYLDQLQEVKAVDADVLRGLVAQAVQMGFSEAQIKSLVEASIGLSKVTGDSLDGSFQKLIGTTKGMARGLLAMVPDLQNLTQEQLRSGEAFAIVADKYKTAADGAGSYTYSVKQAGLAAGELSEDVGKLIVESLNLKGAMETATGVINGIRGAIAAVDMEELSESFKEFISVAGPIALVIGAATAGFTGLTAAVTAAVAPIVLVTAKFALVAIGIAGVVAAIEILVRNFDLFDEALAMIASSIGVLLLKPLENAAYALRDFFGLFGDNAMTKAADQVFKGIEKAVNSLKDNVSKNFSSIKNNMDTGFSGQIVKQATNLMNGFSGEAKKADASLKALGATGSRVKVIDEKAVEAAKKALADIQKQTSDMALQTSSMGASEIEQINLKTAAQLQAVEAKRQELTQQGLINPKLTEALNLQRDTITAYGEKAIKMAEEKAMLEAQKAPLAELKSLNDAQAKSTEQMRLSNLGTFDIINQQAATELQKITALEEQLSIAGALNAENQAALEKAKLTVEEMRSAKAGEAIMSGVNSAVSAAQGGADALVGNMINQIGAAFGPQGQMIAGVVNLLRKGGEFTQQLGKDLIGIIVDLPKMLTEGAVGLINGIVDGLMNLLGDPNKLKDFINNIVTAGPKILAALLRALPQLAIALAKPSFWIDVVISFVKALGDGIGEIWRAIGDVFADIGDALWDAISGIGDAFADIFSGVGSFFKDLFKFDGGGTGVVEDFLGFDFPWLAFAEGGKVPGTPKVFGDSNKNDTVAALLSPGEYVIPRSKMQDPENLMLIDAIMSGGKMKDWIMNAFSGGVQQKAYGEWIQKAQSGGLEFHAWYDDLGDAIVSGVEGAGDFIADTSETVWEGLKEAGSFIGDVFVPDDIKKLWDSITQFISNIDLTRLITDPVGMLKDAIKFASDFLVEPFKKMMSFNTGGLVPGVGFTDTVPAMLTPGEFVINRNAVQSLGSGLLNQLNSGRMPMQESAPIFNINMNIETKDALDANFIRSTLIPTIKSELKASSLRGDFVLSAKGVRS